MAKRIPVVAPPHHFDFLQLAYRGRNRHVVRLPFIPRLRVLQVSVELVPDYQGNELYKDLRRGRLVRAYPETVVAEIGLVPPEELLRGIPSLVEGEGLLRGLVLRGHDGVVAAQLQLAADDIRPFPGAEEDLAP